LLPANVAAAPIFTRHIAGGRESNADFGRPEL
jgi:hypothetical protein